MFFLFLPLPFFPAFDCSGGAKGLWDCILFPCSLAQSKTVDCVCACVRVYSDTWNKWPVGGYNAEIDPYSSEASVPLDVSVYVH